VSVTKAQGPITVSVSKTRIEVMTRGRFTGAAVRKDYLRSTLWLKRQADHRLFTKIELLGKHDWLHHFEIYDEAEIDAELRELLREGRSVGDQAYIPPVEPPS
jgi:hypothetical protein